MAALIALPPDMAQRVLRGDQPKSSDDYDFMSPRLSRRRERTFLHFRIFGRRRDSSHHENRPIEVSNWTLLPTPIPLHLVTEHMEPRSGERIWELLDIPPRPLPGWLSSELQRALAGFIPDYDQILQDKGQGAQSNRAG